MELRVCRLVAGSSSDALLLTHHLPIPSSRQREENTQQDLGHETGTEWQKLQDNVTRILPRGINAFLCPHGLLKRHDINQQDNSSETVETSAPLLFSFALDQDLLP